MSGQKGHQMKMLNECRWMFLFKRHMFYGSFGTKNAMVIFILVFNCTVGNIKASPHKSIFFFKSKASFNIVPMLFSPDSGFENAI